MSDINMSFENLMDFETEISNDNSEKLTDLEPIVNDEVKSPSIVVVRNAVSILKKRNLGQKKSFKFRSTYRPPCTLCTIDFANYTALKKHKRVVHGLIVLYVFKCNLCDAVFQKRVSVTSHIKYSHLIAQLLSNTNDSETSSESNLNLQCNENYSVVEEVIFETTPEPSKELSTVKPRKTPARDSIIKCIECNIPFQKINNLRSHLITHHQLNMDREIHRFPNISAFKKWKCDVERKDMVSFYRTTGAVKGNRSLKRYYYLCHRSGVYVRLSKRPLNKIPNTSGTCKMGIMCTSTITCVEYPTHVAVVYYPNHYGHGKGKPYMQLSTEEHIAIQENVSNGLSYDELLDDIRDTQSSVDHHQLSLLRKRDMRFIESAYSTDEFNVDVSDAESVDNWVRQCCEVDDSPVLFYRRAELGSNQEDFMLITMTEFQKQILVSCSRHVLCVHTLIGQRGGRFALTAMFIMDEYDAAFPVAFCISKKVDRSCLTQFFISVRESTGPLSCTYFMSDFEKFYHESWLDVMEDESRHVWNIWAVDYEIQTRARRIKNNIPKRTEAYKTMRKIWECKNVHVFQTMLKNFLDSMMGDPSTVGFGKFILAKYAPTAELWAYCYRKDVMTSTSARLEVLQQSFRYCCKLGRKKRLDKFIFVLMKLMRNKMLDRLANMLDEEKTRLAKEAINICHGLGLEIPCDCISALSEKIWMIRSEDDLHHVYITREFDVCPEHCDLKCADCNICVHMYSCSCLQSLIHANMCQHIHAVVWKLLTPHFSPPSSPSGVEDLEADVPVACDADELFKNVLKRMQDVYKTVTANKCHLSMEAIESILNHQNECIAICSGKNEPPKTPAVVGDSHTKKSVSTQTLSPCKKPVVVRSPIIPPCKKPAAARSPIISSWGCAAAKRKKLSFKESLNNEEMVVLPKSSLVRLTKANNSNSTSNTPTKYVLVPADNQSSTTTIENTAFSYAESPNQESSASQLLLSLSKFQSIVNDNPPQIIPRRIASIKKVTLAPSQMQSQNLKLLPHRNVIQRNRLRKQTLLHSNMRKIALNRPIHSASNFLSEESVQPPTYVLLVPSSPSEAS